MQPFLGAGAGQAMKARRCISMPYVNLLQDAFILGQILSDPAVNTSNITDLKVYEEIRKPIAHDVVDRSRKMSLLMLFHPDVLPPDADIEKVTAGDIEHLEKVANAMQDLWSFHYTKMADKD